MHFNLNRTFKIILSAKKIVIFLTINNIPVSIFRERVYAGVCQEKGGRDPNYQLLHYLWEIQQQEVQRAEPRGERSLSQHV